MLKLTPRSRIGLRSRLRRRLIATPDAPSKQALNVTAVRRCRTAGCSSTTSASANCHVRSDARHRDGHRGFGERRRELVWTVGRRDRSCTRRLTLFIDPRDLTMFVSIHRRHRARCRGATDAGCSAHSLRRPPPTAKGGCVPQRSRLPFGGPGAGEGAKGGPPSMAHILIRRRSFASISRRERSIRPASRLLNKR